MKTPVRILAKVLLFLLLGHVVPLESTFCLSTAGAQDPFGGMDGGELGNTDVNPDPLGLDVVPARNERSAKSDFDPNEMNAVVLSLKAHPPKTPAEFARAIQLMVRIQRWEEAGRWLDQAAKLGLDESLATQMIRTAGTQTFATLVSPDSKLTMAEKSTANSILDLASRAARDPKKLSLYAEQLRGNNKSERIRAFRSLESAGSLGVAALINHFLSERATVPSPTQCEAFSLMGKSAVSAWQAAMMTQHADARGRLALLAVRLGESALTAELCAVAVDERVGREFRDALTQVAASKQKSIPKSSAVYRFAIDQMEKSLDQFQKNRWIDEPDVYTIWRLSADGRIVSEQSARLADVHWSRAVQLAHTSLRCSFAADRDSAAAVSVVLEDVARAPSLAIESLSLGSVATQLPTIMRDSYEFGCLVWDAAERSNLSTAQWLAVRNLARWSIAESLPIAVRDRLSQACRSGYGPVRYAAAEGLLNAMAVTSEAGEPQFRELSFDGRNRLERVLSEMRQLEGKPAALVVGGNAELRTHTRTLLETFGYRVSDAASSAQTLSALGEGVPVEAVFIVDHVLEMNLGQLIQRVRSNPVTASCPIALLAASLSRGEHEIAGSDSRVVMGSVPPLQAAFGDILRRMAIVNQSPAIDGSNRVYWRELSENYWLDTQKRFVSALPKSPTQPLADTPLSQQRLIRLTLDNSIPLPQREQASQIFVQSVKQFGVMVSSETANAQYDEYNRRGRDDLDLRRVLGRILDAIEAGKGDRPWADVAS